MWKRDRGDSSGIWLCNDCMRQMGNTDRDYYADQREALLSCSSGHGGAMDKSEENGVRWGELLKPPDVAKGLRRIAVNVGGSLAAQHTAARPGLEHAGGRKPLSHTGGER